jgi:7-cyano-7-deazaguanine synthase
MICVLFSGGLDSMLLAEIAHRQNVLGSLFHVSYGQRASAQEYRAAQKYASKRALPLERAIVSVRGLDDMNQAPGVTGARVVPARNLIMIAHAVNYASACGFEEIWYGACADDLADYADCRPAFVMALDDLTATASGIRIRAPLIDKTKSQILDLAKSYGIDSQDAWSCYAPKNDAPCGKCNSCVAVLGGKQSESNWQWYAECCKDRDNHRRDPTTGILECVSCGGLILGMHHGAP